MTRDAKRLRRLLDLRRRQEEAARVQLAQSLRRAAEISDEVRDRTEALEDVLGGNLEPRRRQHLETITSIAQPAILAAHAAESSARGTAEEIRREWRRTARRLKGLERLEDRRVAEELEVGVRSERQQIDDAMSSRQGDEEQ